MRTRAALLAMVSLLLAARAMATAHNMAATPVPVPLSKQAVHRLDNLECQLQAEQQEGARRNQARFVQHCMHERQRAEKAAVQRR